MSYTVTKFVLDLAGLTPSEKAVAHSLAYHANMDGTNAYPSMETIAREAGIKHRQSVQKIVRRLEEKGLIVADGPKSGGRFKATKYRFNLGNSSPTAAVLRKETAALEHRNSSPTDQKQQPYDCTKDPKRSEKDPVGNADAFQPPDWVFDRPEWVFHLLHDEWEILHSLPAGLKQWVSCLRPLPSLIQLSDKQAAKSFRAVNELLCGGVARLIGKNPPYRGSERGSISTLFDYERIWALDERYGVGTAEGLANQIVHFGVDRHVSIRTFVWNHFVDQLIDAASKG